MTKTNRKEMTYERACELLGYRTTNSVERNAALAEIRLMSMAINAPLRYQVAASILIKAAAK